MKAAVFDLGGVVFDDVPERRLATLAELTGLAAATIRKRLFDSGYSTACDAGRFDAAGAHREAERLLGFRLGYERFAHLWVSAFEPNAAVLDVVRQLRGRCAIALLTNNSVLVKTTLNELYPEVMTLFRPQVFSADIGRLKPHPKTYLGVADMLGAAPADIVVIDDAAKNVAGAAALGFETIHYHAPAELRAALPWPVSS